VWEWEKSVRTPADRVELLRIQMPFHFSGEPPPDFAAGTIYAPEVLRHFANEGYGDFDYMPHLGRVSKRRCSWSVLRIERPPLAPRVGSTRESLTASWPFWTAPGHMSMIEAQDAYLAAVKRFLRGVG